METEVLNLAVFFRSNFFLYLDFFFIVLLVFVDTDLEPSLDGVLQMARAADPRVTDPF